MSDPAHDGRPASSSSNYSYTSDTSDAPVRKIAEASVTGHATNIIAGLAVGQHGDRASAVFCIASSIWLKLTNPRSRWSLTRCSRPTWPSAMAGIIISLDALRAGSRTTPRWHARHERFAQECAPLPMHLDAVGNTMKAGTRAMPAPVPALASDTIVLSAATT